MASGHDRRGFLRELLRGAAQTAAELDAALRPAEERLEAHAGVYGGIVHDAEGRQETLPAARSAYLASTDDLRALCAELDREPWADAAVALARTSIRLTRGGSGRSRLGGVPDVPPGFEWPVWRDEELTCVACIRLDELPESELPRAGTLLVFFARHIQPNGLRPWQEGGCRVAVVPSTPAERLERPGGLPELLVVPSAELTLPAEPGDLAESSDDLDAWLELRERLAALQGVTVEDVASGYHSLHRLLGHPDSPDDEMPLDAQLVAHDIDLTTGAHHVDPEAERLAPGAAEWRLLFQLSSDDELGLSLGYYERLYVWIREHDLRAGRFDAVRAFVR